MLAGDPSDGGLVVLVLVLLPHFDLLHELCVSAATNSGPSSIVFEDGVVEVGSQALGVSSCVVIGISSGASRVVCFGFVAVQLHIFLARKIKKRKNSSKKGVF